MTEFTEEYLNSPKLCKKCFISKDFSSFEKGRNVCKLCRKLQKSISNKVFRLNFPEKYKEIKKRDYQNNWSKYQTRSNSYKEKHPEKIASYKRKHYLANREKFYQKAKVYSQNSIKNLTNVYLLKQFCNRTNIKKEDVSVEILVIFKQYIKIKRLLKEKRQCQVELLN